MVECLLATSPTLTLHNPGITTLHLDALQIEQRNPATERAYELGLHTSTSLAYDSTHALTPERCRDWSVLRCTTRTLWIGPPSDPHRWDRYDHHVERYLALHPRCQFIFEGTPMGRRLSRTIQHRRQSQGNDTPKQHRLRRNHLPYKTYTIEHTESLSPLSWQPLGTHTLSTSINHTLSVTYPLPPNAASGFYRVIVRE